MPLDESCGMDYSNSVIGCDLDKRSLAPKARALRRKATVSHPRRAWTLGAFAFQMTVRARQLVGLNGLHPRNTTKNSGRCRGPVDKSGQTTPRTMRKRLMLREVGAYLGVSHSLKSPASAREFRGSARRDTNSRDQPTPAMSEAMQMTLVHKDIHKGSTKEAA